MERGDRTFKYSLHISYLGINEVFKSVVLLRFSIDWFPNFYDKGNYLKGYNITIYKISQNFDRFENPSFKICTRQNLAVVALHPS